MHDHSALHYPKSTPVSSQVLALQQDYSGKFLGAMTLLSTNCPTSDLLWQLSELELILAQLQRTSFYKT
jgi:hypothetical protein